MRKINWLYSLLTLASFGSIAQLAPPTDTLRQQYQAGQKIASRSFAGYFYPNRNQLYALPEKAFVATIDSLRSTFQTGLDRYKIQSNNADTTFIAAEQTGIHFFFDKLLLDYPYFHEIATGKKGKLSLSTQNRLDANLSYFNHPALLNSEDLKAYVRGFLQHAATAELRKSVYKRMDNQRLNSTLKIIPVYFTNQTCRDFWQYDYLNNHIENLGAKTLENVIRSFRASCRDTAYKRKIIALYTEAKKERENHLIKTYKTVNGFDLDIHLFLPDSAAATQRPVIVYFSGGSWTNGSPEWAFYNCAAYAKKGWVAASVEYRLADRQGTTPFEAVKDARSAIRWLRKHAQEYNIDTHKIVVTGNSAGGHLILATALADKWNESTDDLHYSPTPNLLMVNAGVYDFMQDENTAWVSKDLKDKNTVKEISPVHLVKKGLPPMLLIHGTHDQSVPYSTAKAFATASKEAGNEVEFQTLEGAGHAIWFDRRFTQKIAALRAAFLKKYGYE
ncbi:alpha/beta hydrolase [Pseudoflavitalea sp. X16]|uniref:alpha/beta hydrolase n=1 Tax=Paraflavitalea devenefica TaxID=2716334 RepID=UPI00141E7D73|nr:alpha/beta hydrolase [Paraflavitalea devenefica]NII26990.1 alpha/beta hydrolase [Paraflavitalea devenefica]